MELLLAIRMKPWMRRLEEMRDTTVRQNRRKALTKTTEEVLEMYNKNIEAATQKMKEEIASLRTVFEGGRKKEARRLDEPGPKQRRQGRGQPTTIPVAIPDALIVTTIVVIAIVAVIAATTTVSGVVIAAPTTASAIVIAAVAVSSPATRRRHR